MKKTLLTLALVAATAAAFAQGKIQVQNDGASPIQLADSNHVLAADQGVAGQNLNTSAALPSGKLLTLGVYVGATSSSLSLAALSSASPSTANPFLLNGATGSGVPGALVTQKFQLAGFAGGTVFVQYKVWDSAFPDFASALAGNSYTGQNNVFSITLGTGISYPATTSGGGTTWTTAGNENPLIVGTPGSVTPEPGTMALAGLGAAAMMVFRRRNK